MTHLGMGVLRTRTAVAVAAVAAASLALAACSSSGGSTAPKTGSTGSAAAASGQVTWWGWTPDAPVAQKYIAEFNKVYPNITVKYTNYQNADYAPSMSTAFQTGAGPDIFDVSAGGNVGGKQLWGQYAMDMAPVAQQLMGASWKDKFATGYVDDLTDSGKVVALPLGGVAADFFWIDKDLFDKVGVPTSIKTYGDLKAACDKFQAAGVQCFTMGTNSTDTFSTELLRTIMSSIDPTYYMKALHGQASWDDPVFTQAIDMLRKMQTDGIISQDATSIKQYPDSNNNFMAGKAAIVQMGTWYAQYAAKPSMLASMQGAGVSNPVPFTMLPMVSPDFAGKGNIPGYVGEADYGLAINAKANNPEAAKTFVTWLTTTKEGQQDVGNAIDLVPALKGVQADWTALGLVSADTQIPIFQKLFTDAANAPESRNLYISAETGNAQVVAVQEALADKSKSAEAIAKEAQTNSVPLK
jgi:ABC-type glycerol-3-phosphate transport system substrate-binding protein